MDGEFVVSLLARRVSIVSSKAEVLTPLTVLISSDSPIDTGILISSNTIMTIRANRDNGASHSGDIFSDGTTFLCKRNGAYSNGSKAFNETYEPYIKASTTKNFIIDGVEHRAQWATNNTNYFVANDFVQASRTMRLAVYRSYSAAGYKFYYVKATVDGVLVNDLRPYLKNGKPGFLDIITNEFHTVATGGTDWTYA